MHPSGISFAVGAYSLSVKTVGIQSKGIFGIYLYDMGNSFSQKAANFAS